MSNIRKHPKGQKLLDQIAAGENNTMKDGIEQFTDVQIYRWADRNDINGNISQLRCALKDARSLISNGEEDNVDTRQNDLFVPDFGRKLTQEEVIEAISATGDASCSACGCLWIDHHIRCEGSES